jgi:hypothetical protein
VIAICCDRLGPAVRATLITGREVTAHPECRNGALLGAAFAPEAQIRPLPPVERASGLRRLLRAVRLLGVAR